MIRRFLAVLHSRNLEFIRDRSSLGWNVVMPVLLVFGLAFIFAGTEQAQFKVGVLQPGQALKTSVHPFLTTRYIQFVPVEDRSKAVRDVARHRIDMLLELHGAPRYWINPESPKGYILEKVLEGSHGDEFRKVAVEGAPVRYIDWLVPGILGMNMMFSCLYGVGYVVVRYRKNGFLKRLYATPLRAVEFLGAQIVSRLLLILVVTVAVYLGTDFFIGFRMEGGYAALFVAAMLGAISMISLALVVAARIASEELANGLLNIIAWPMVLLSGVWFSLEGTHPLLQQAAKLLPLTQMLDAARAIMLDGAGFREVVGPLAALTVMSLLFLGLGAALFKWSPQ